MRAIIYGAFFCFVMIGFVFVPEENSIKQGPKTITEIRVEEVGLI